MTPVDFMEDWARNPGRMDLLLKPPYEDGRAYSISAPKAPFKVFAAGAKLAGKTVIVTVTLNDEGQITASILNRHLANVFEYAFRLWQYKSGDSVFATILDPVQLQADVDSDPRHADKHIIRRLERAIAAIRLAAEGNPLFLKIGRSGAELQRFSMERRYEGNVREPAFRRSSHRRRGSWRQLSLLS